jgi:hypothetical protein
MTQEAFKRLSKRERYVIVRDRATFLASRLHGGFQVGLYRIGDLYIEVWKRVGLDYLEYIELVDEKKVRDAYLDNLNLPG